MSKTIYAGRRKVVWKKLKDFKVFVAASIATALGAGFSPIGPGSAGSLMGLPLVYLTLHWSFLTRVLFWSALTLIGSWAAAIFDRSMGTHDNQNIVVDEVIGVAITAWTVGEDIRTWIAAFVLFRFFDILKPPPVRSIDSWSKIESSPFLGGFAVIADDMVAGLQGLGVILFLQWMHILP